MIKGIIFAIKRYTIHDGPGIRVTVFFKGCPLDCWWCHNPEGRNPLPENTTREVTYDGDKTLRFEETIGKEMTVDEVVFEIEKERPFFDESGGGVTASGGEPLAQPEFLRDLFKECKRRDIHTVLDTSGYAAPEVFDSVIDFVDLFLFDLKSIDKDKHLKYTGVSNELILRNLNALVARKKPTIVRFAVIPGINDSNEDVNNMANYVASLKGVNKISLLPFHAIAGDKYRRLGIENRMAGVEEPTSGRMESIKKVFEDKGLEVEIGG